MAKLEKSEIARIMLYDMPGDFQSSLLDEQTLIPLPKYDQDGLFKNFVTKKNVFSPFQSTQNDSMVLSNRHVESILNSNKYSKQ